MMRRIMVYMYSIVGNEAPTQTAVVNNLNAQTAGFNNIPAQSQNSHNHVPLSHHMHPTNPPQLTLTDAGAAAVAQNPHIITLTLTQFNLTGAQAQQLANNMTLVQQHPPLPLDNQPAPTGSTPRAR